jgi:hypothetical protein
MFLFKMWNILVQELRKNALNAVAELKGLDNLDERILQAKRDEENNEQRRNMSLLRC